MNQEANLAQVPSQPQYPKHVLPELTLEEKVEQIVSYHKPDEAGIQAITNIRKATANLIGTILLNCPDSPDRSAAIRKARETMMTANASIVVPQVRL